MLEMSSRHIKVGNQQSRINWHKQAMEEVVTTKIFGTLLNIRFTALQYSSFRYHYFQIKCLTYLTVYLKIQFENPIRYQYTYF